MTRFKVVLEYAGTRYSGWQIQKNARTVQGEITAAVRRVSERTDFEIQGAGRTDAGVHALAQVAHVDLNTKLEAERLRFALNDALPADINILSIETVPRRFHARHDASARAYLYQISRRRTAFAKPFVWWVKDALAAPPMVDAVRRLTGMHDFAAFTADDPESKSTKVAIERAALREEGDLVLIRIVGSHFLWKMVRRIVGIVVEVGRGRLKPADVDALLGARSPSAAAEFTAPPSGLFLERVLYGAEAKDWPVRPAFPVAAMASTRR